jgi:hypothetical protein
VAGKRLEVANALANDITEGIGRLSGMLSQLDDVALYGPILDVYMSAIKLP